MTTQQLPAVSSSPDPSPGRIGTARTKVLIGAGTALKAGFFFAFGVMLFSIVVTLVIGLIAVTFGLSLHWGWSDLFGS